MSGTWKTKFGPRRVRHDPPTIAEAITAARGLTDDREQQVQFAAGLMGVSLAEARAEMKKVGPEANTSIAIVPSLRDKGSRVVVIERKVSRRLMTKPPLPQGAKIAIRSR